MYIPLNINKVIKSEKYKEHVKHRQKILIACENSRIFRINKINYIHRENLKKFRKEWRLSSIYYPLMIY